VGDWPVFDFFRQVLAAEEGLVRAALGEEREARTLLRRRHEESPSPEVAVALASLELADGDPAGALELVSARGRTEFVATNVEAAVIAAIAHQSAGSEAAAARCIEHALDLAEPLGLRRVIVAHGAPVRSLLRSRLLRQTGHAALVGELLEDLDRDHTLPRLGRTVPVQPLSGREEAVLRYLPMMLSFKEIAKELYVSPNTLKTHARNIYRKLGISSRRDLARLARPPEPPFEAPSSDLAPRA
jgi:LuxR family maltose regulon positive regulatory protein